MTPHDTTEFIMLPTVDFCFQALMQNPKVRKGFVAAILDVDPLNIKNTILLPTQLSRESETDKLGILDVNILLADGTQLNLEMQVRYFEYWDERVLFYLSKMFTGQIKKGEDYDTLKKCIHVSILNFIHFPDDICYRTIHFRDDITGQLYTDKMEIHVLELQKLPQNLKLGNEIITWMQFFSGRTQEDFKNMAKVNEYIEEAYDTLLKLSADDLKRMEYEAREKALRDYNSQMKSASRRGEKLGEKRGEERTKRIFKLYSQGKSIKEIAELCGVSVEKVTQILE